MASFIDRSLALTTAGSGRQTQTVLASIWAMEDLGVNHILLFAVFFRFTLLSPPKDTKRTNAHIL